MIPLLFFLAAAAFAELRATDEYELVTSRESSIEVVLRRAHQTLAHIAVRDDADFKAESRSQLQAAGMFDVETAGIIEDCPVASFLAAHSSSAGFVGQRCRHSMCCMQDGGRGTDVTML